MSTPVINLAAMNKLTAKSFPRRKRMVVLPKRIDDALRKRARHMGQGLSPMIRAYVIDGLKRDGMLEPAS